MSSRSSSSLLRELNQAFTDLSLVQARISRVAAALARRPRSPSLVPLAVAVPVSVASSPEPPPPPSNPLAPSGTISKGDRVRINFPRSWQQPIGLAESYRSGFITVRTPNGEGVQRYKKNLTLLDRAGTF